MFPEAADFIEFAFYDYPVRHPETKLYDVDSLIEQHKTMVAHRFICEHAPDLLYQQEFSHINHHAPNVRKLDYDIVRQAFKWVDCSDEEQSRAMRAVLTDKDFLFFENPLIAELEHQKNERERLKLSKSLRRGA